MDRQRIVALSAELAALLDEPVPVTPTCGTSKSRFLAGAQCHKRLYLKVHHPELAGEVDEAREAIMQQGTEVGLLARRAFPGGVLITADREHLAEAIRDTRELVANSEVPAIFEATFEHNGVVVRVDVLERCEAEYRPIEVKSSLAVKPYYLRDVGIQKYVLKGAGLRISGAYVMHLNRDYVYDGKRDEHGHRCYDLSRLFVLADVQPARGGDISEELNAQFKMLDSPDAPEVEPGSQCEDPFLCEFYTICHDWDDNDLRSLPIERWKIGALWANGIRRINQLPESAILRSRFHFTRDECRMACAAKDGKILVENSLAAQLNTLRYPICYLDFETVNPGLPWFAGTSPYDQIPFQWSAQQQDRPGSPLRRLDFLPDEANADPREPFARSLCEAAARVKTIVVYGNFESKRLEELAEWVPKYRKALVAARGKLWDLKPVVKRNVCHPGFCGSYTLKSVLPALVPSMGYDKLAIQAGSQAGRAWMQMVSATDAGERDYLRRALLEYCGQDTIGLAHILRVLSKLSNKVAPPPKKSVSRREAA